MCRSLLTILFLIPLASLGRAGDDAAHKDQRPIVLAAGSSKVLSMPGFSAATGQQCDSSGNLYFRTGYSARATVVLKIAEKDGSPTVYRVTDPTADGTYFVAFHVTPGKRIAILVGSKKNELIEYQFKEDDPVNASHTALEAPEGLDALTVQGFVIVPNDHIMLQGYFSDAASEDKRGHGYLAEFAPSVKLLRLSLDKVSDELLKSVARRGANTAVAHGQDGMTYLLEADRVVVLSPAGDVNR